MNSKFSVRFIVIVLCISLAIVGTPVKARADSLDTAVTEIFVAIIVVGVGIGVGIYFAVRPHHPPLKGCVTSTPDGLQLFNASDQTKYLLIGDIADIKVGDVVKVSGKKQKLDKNNTVPAHSYIVEKLNKDYGPCKVQPATP